MEKASLGYGFLCISITIFPHVWRIYQTLLFGTVISFGGFLFLLCSTWVDHTILKDLTANLPLKPNCVWLFNQLLCALYRPLDQLRFLHRFLVALLPAYFSIKFKSQAKDQSDTINIIVSPLIVFIVCLNAYYALFEPSIP